MLTLNDYVKAFNDILWSWPLIIFIVATGVIITIACNFVQFRYFFTAWRYALTPEKRTETDKESYISPFQAFINTLSASIGNGSTAGMATAIFAGGPGAAFWMFVLGFFNMAIRFAEVYLSTSILEKSATGALRGGPMVYLSKVPGGKFLPAFYAFFILLFTFITGSAMQCNSISLGVSKITAMPVYLIAAMLFTLLLYIMLGGAPRIIKISDRIVPVKVGLFFISIIIALIYQYNLLGAALVLIVKSAFAPAAISGALIGLSVQNAMRFAAVRTINATEAGLGTAGILFGTTASKHPARSGIMSMASTFISNHLVCFGLMLVIVASGVWDSGLTSTPLTIAAYKTVFGTIGGWIVTFLSITFGLGVLVTYAYIGRESWLFLTKGRFEWAYMAIYCLMAVFGSLGKVDLIWNMTDIINAGLLIANLYGLLYFLPHIRKGMQDYAATEISQ